MAISVNKQVLSMALGVLVAVLVLRSGGAIALLSQAVGVEGESSEGVGGLVRVANALKTPMLIGALACMPLIFIGGAIMIGIGNRRGLQVIGGILAMAMLLASVGGISA